MWCKLSTKDQHQDWFEVHVHSPTYQEIASLHDEYLHEVHVRSSINFKYKYLFENFHEIVWVEFLVTIKPMKHKFTKKKIEIELHVERRHQTCKLLLGN